MTRTCLLAILFLLGGWPGAACNVHAQGNPFFDRLSLLPDVTVTQIAHPRFPGGYFILSIPQPLDHADSSSARFSHRVFLGLQTPEAPVVMVTDGYGVDYAGKPDYQHELSTLLQANLLVVEHRYFGKSQPATLDYRWLTVQQAAADLHAIKVLLDTLLTGPWLSTGTSKGGQAALAHRMHYPEDVAATVVYGTAVKKVSSITTSELLQPLLESECGKKVLTFQKHLFQHRDSIFPAFIARVATLGLDLGDMDIEVAFDYASLEFPFSFWQGGFTCDALPPLSAPASALSDFFMAVVPPRQYSALTRKRWLPAYYMFYHELGYYEYDPVPFKSWLKQTSYPNQFFAPEGMEIPFDRSYLQAARDFLDAPAAHSVFFIYGEYDPWALQSVVVSNKYVVPGGSHKSKVADLPEDLRTALMQRIGRCLHD